MPSDLQIKNNLKVVNYKQISNRLHIIAHDVILGNKTEIEIADAIHQLRNDIIHTNYIGGNQ